MTPDEFEAKMRAIYPEDNNIIWGDKEASHGNADDLLCEALKELGYGKGVEVFKDADKWYA